MDLLENEAAVLTAEYRELVVIHGSDLFTAI